MKVKTRPKPADLLYSLIVLLFSATFIYPLLYMLAGSFKSNNEYYQNPVSLLVENPSLNNFISVFSRLDIPRGFLNSAVIAVCSVLAITLVALVASHTFALFSFRFRYGIYMVIISTMFIPAQVTMIPVYVMFSRAGLTNTHLSVILLYLAGGLPATIMLFTAGFRAIPRSLYEAARIDGASNLMSVFRITLPLGRPIIAISAITNLIGYWNDLFTPLILLTDNNMKTIMVMITGLYQKNFGQPMVKMAAMTLTVFPALLVFIIFQKQIVKGLTSGAVK